MYTDWRMGFEDAKEERQLRKLSTLSPFPSRLQGTLYRNGPAKFSIGKESLRHWFDGFALLHAFSFEKGNVSYTSSFLKSKAYTYQNDTNTLGYSEFASDPEYSWIQKMRHLINPNITDNCNVNIVQKDGCLYAITETPYTYVFDKDLNNQRLCSSKDNFHYTTQSAHPFIDTNGTEINFYTKIGITHSYNFYYRKKYEHERKVLVSIPVKEVSYIHSFSVTENFFILIDYPYYFDIKKAVFSGTSFFDSFTRKKEQPSRIRLIEKSTGKIVNKREIEGFFCLHHINAYEKEQKIYVDLISFDDASVLPSFLIKNLLTKPGVTYGGNYVRLTIDREKSIVSKVSIEKSRESERKGTKK